MIISVLCENTALPLYFCEHGLSLYIQTQSHHILFDAGQSDVFLKNAEKLGIDLSLVDTFVLSHGHYDHGDGLQYFLQINDHATLYIHKKAFGDFYHGDRYIGIAKEQTIPRDRLCLISHDTVIDDEISFLTSITNAQSQTELTEYIHGRHIPDAFEHELYLLISDANKKAIFTGCGHKGIGEIAKMANAQDATHIIGGFHLTDRTDDAHIVSVAGSLAAYPIAYYTGHCTSMHAYNLLQSKLNNQIHQLHSGMRFVIGDHASVARFLFRLGYNCSQAVFGAFAEDLNLDFETAMRLSCSFGGGMGRMREVCGAVSGMLMVCGAIDGYSTPETGHIKAEHYKKIQQLANIFRTQYNSIICRELLGGTVSNEPIPTARTDEFYKIRPCERLVAYAAAIAEEYLL